MPQAKQVAQYNTFIAGLITEATELTFPPNSSYAEDNCILYPKGNRTRRPGIDFEEGYSLSSYTMTDTNLTTWAIHTGNWSSVANVGTLNFLVVQTGNTLRFYDLSNSVLSSSLKSFTVNLNSYLAPASTTAENDKVSVAVGRGDLFVVSPSIKPIQIRYSVSGDSITVSPISIMIRDFSGLDDGLTVDNQPATLSAAHQYNLLNQGWYPTASTYDPVSVYFGATAVYPPNNFQWTSAKKTDGTLDVSLLRTSSPGLTHAPKGHYILDPFYKDRSSVSGVGGITVEAVDERPKAITFFAGRVAYGFQSEVYLSQVLTQDRDNAGKCYQDADPTSDDISDLVANDGLVVTIPEAGEILALDTTGAHLMVFARNGVWSIANTAGGFSASDFSVNRITSAGIVNRNAVISIEGTLIWLSDTGIFKVSAAAGLDNITGSPNVSSLSDKTVKTFYLDIDSVVKSNMSCVYDSANKIVIWLYKDSTGTPVNSSPYYFNKVLILDTIIGAYYTWTIESLTGESPFIANIFTTPSLNQGTDTPNVIDSSGNLVIDTALDQVTSGNAFDVGNSTYVKYLCVVPNKNDATNTVTFSLFQNKSFTDWEKYDILNNGGAGADYDSYVETGFELQGDLVRFKQAPYITTHLKKTLDSDSSAFIQARWDWSNDGSSGKWSTVEQVYRSTLINNTNGNLLVSARSRIRGKGRAFQLRFSSESGKDFDILGWGIVFTGNTEV